MTPGWDGAKGGSALEQLYAGYETWKGWDALFSYTPEDAAYFDGQLKGIPVKGAALLEIGFGAGTLLAWARDQGATVAGTEISRASLEAARAAGVDILPAAFETVAAQYAGRFDVIAALDVFEHFSLEEILTRLAAAETMLKPGGRLVLRFPNAQSPFGLAPQLGDPTHRTALSRSAFEQLVRGTSLVIESYQASYLPGGNSLRRRLVRTAQRLARAAITHALNAIYAQVIPWDPVVVLVLRKPS